MKFSDEVLMAYADNELDEQTRAAVRAAMAGDPLLARRIARHQALRQRLRSAFEPVLSEPVPAALLRSVRTAPVASPAPEQGNVIPLRRRGAPGRWRAPRWAALAASLVVGVLAGGLAFHGGGSGPIATRGGHMLASGPLARALTNQLVARERVAQPVRIGVSFKSKAGDYCRTFSMRSPAMAGMACHAPDGWRLRVLTGAPERGAATGGYRQAASAMPPAVVAAVNSEISGEPLDARAEALARRRGWKR